MAGASPFAGQLLLDKLRPPPGRRIRRRMRPDDRGGRLTVLTAEGERRDSNPRPRVAVKVAIETAAFASCGSVRARSDRAPDRAPAGPPAGGRLKRTTQLYRCWDAYCAVFLSSTCGRTLACGQSVPGSDSLLGHGPAAARSARASCSQPAGAPGSGRSARDACSSRDAALGPAPGIRDQSDSGRTTATSRAGAPPPHGTARPL
jgi:hypothetical protein